MKIEKNIPIPPRIYSKGRPKCELRIAMETMEIGDSVVITKIKRQQVGSLAKIMPNRKFTTRAVELDQVRVWRIK